VSRSNSINQTLPIKELKKINIFQSKNYMEVVLKDDPSELTVYLNYFLNKMSKL